MKILYIPKKTKGKFRKICILDARQKNENKSWVPYLNKMQKQLCDLEIVHGFMQGASPVTNANKHISYTYTLSFDLADFFDTIRPEMVRHLKEPASDAIIFDDKLIEACFFTDPDTLKLHAFQGIPTSPIIANLAAINLDNKLKSLCKSLKGVVYTRYADDLSFSFNNYSYYETLKNGVPEIIAQEGFILNDNKTRLQDGTHFNRIITGITVGYFSINPTRKTKKKLRAAKHKAKYAYSVMGLEEWCKLKEPKQTGANQFVVDKDELQHISYSRNDVIEDSEFKHGAEGHVTYKT